MGIIWAITDCYWNCTARMTAGQSCGCCSVLPLGAQGATFATGAGIGPPPGGAGSYRPPSRGRVPVSAAMIAATASSIERYGFTRGGLTPCSARKRRASSRLGSGSRTWPVRGDGSEACEFFFTHWPHRTGFSLKLPVWALFWLIGMNDGWR